jgi:radical SAM protein with 4Fe4S-binding SPASM domain
MRFRKIYIEISNICNMDCDFCHGTRRKPESMSVENFAGIARQVRDMTEQVYLHVTGEPLLHPEFPRIIQICAEHNLPVEITTNGSMMKSVNAESLLNPVVRQVNISMHAFLQSDISRLREIFDFTRKAFDLRPDLYINYRLWNLNASQESLDSEKNEWMHKKIEEEFHATIPATGHSTGRKSRRILNRLYLHLDTRFEWPEISHEKPLKTHGKCHALKDQAAILVDGTVVPCCLDKEGIMALGNCFEESFESIINGTRAKKIIKGFQEGRLFEELCKHCSYSSRFS